MTRVPDSKSTLIDIVLCGDVMLGRGIDQILPAPSDPQLYEGFATSAIDYVMLAEEANGPITRPAQLSYPWGFALEEWRHSPPDLRIINLETSITRSDAYIPKGINYRVSPANAAALVTAGIDCCVLANNHVLDWGVAGLLETLAVTEQLGIRTAGAGRTVEEASAPAILEVKGKGRVAVYSFASETSGTPRSWVATPLTPGVNLIPDLSNSTVRQITELVEATRRPGDLIIISIHWGPNWGYEISPQQRRFAHALIDQAGVSIVHGHSSHHPQALEIYRDRLILYGCGDLLNDYEGIAGYERYRGDLSLAYRATLDPNRMSLVNLEMTPFQIRQLSLHQASAHDTEWLENVLARESAPFGVTVRLGRNRTLHAVCSTKACDEKLVRE
ncbi:CapA family protein [Microvirga terricola]|uniref:CapA family protein n=1 Tax=Microvirga terricola TaxID=2719797 RepID=A0ABX0VFT3_9HYPH|nr:CapA family protein [Microvirga terricola]NIX78393.1 CapA family protein [Microvirga terricola]